MQILLPPSEGKAKPEGGEPVDLDSLVFAGELSEKREELIDAFEPALLKAPAAPAAEVYTGVLYGRLDLAGLTAAARRRAAKRVLIASALWGFVRLEDRIPYYRLPPSTKLDGIGPLAARWREALATAVPDTRRARRSSTCARAPTSPSGSRSGRPCWRCAPFARRRAGA